MKKILTKIKNLVNWQKIKFQNRNGYRKKILNKWIAEGRKVPPPHVVKQNVIKNFHENYSSEILVETGTFRGEMVFAQRMNFKKIISIELSQDLFKLVEKRLKKYKNVTIIQGDSGILLSEIIDKIDKPAIFWLDGHYSGFETAKGDLETPIERELQLVLSHKINHIILVDDARMFVGKNDYPTIQQLKDFIFSMKKNYLFNVEDDIIRIFPPLK
jgi:hypothetical protein